MGTRELLKIFDSVAFYDKNFKNLNLQITFYHYEVFIILMDLIGDKNIEKRNYLCFLQNYTRNG